MKFAVVTLFAVCAIASVSGSKYCSHEDSVAVLESWNGIMDGGNTAPIMLSTFLEVFKSIYAKHSDAKKMFARVGVDNMESPEYKAHVLRVANAFDDVLNKLHNHQVVDEMLDHLASAHAKRTALKKVYFKDLSTELGKVLSITLDRYDPDAWNNCVSGIVDGISASLS